MLAGTTVPEDASAMLNCDGFASMTAWQAELLEVTDAKLIVVTWALVVLAFVAVKVTLWPPSPGTIAPAIDACRATLPAVPAVVEP